MKSRLSLGAKSANQVFRVMDKPDGFLLVPEDDHRTVRSDRYGRVHLRLDNAAVTIQEDGAIRIRGRRGEPDRTKSGRPVDEDNRTKSGDLEPPASIQGQAVDPDSVPSMADLFIEMDQRHGFKLARSKSRYDQRDRDPDEDQVVPEKLRQEASPPPRSTALDPTVPPHHDPNNPDPWAVLRDQLQEIQEENRQDLLDQYRAKGHALPKSTPMDPVVHHVDPEDHTVEIACQEMVEAVERDIQEQRAAHGLPPDLDGHKPRVPDPEAPDLAGMFGQLAERFR